MVKKTKDLVPWRYFLEHFNTSALYHDDYFVYILNFEGKNVLN